MYKQTIKTVSIDKDEHTTANRARHRYHHASQHALHTPNDLQLRGQSPVRHGKFLPLLHLLQEAQANDRLMGCGGMLWKNHQRHIFSCSLWLHISIIGQKNAMGSFTKFLSSSGPMISKTFSKGVSLNACRSVEQWSVGAMRLNIIDNDH
ncbi:hypothetical protein TraAM80_07263 [Trypanosoma rangeli]|uniref:Uncharacterized protein n=1 Tax=Trypanosoma rangeli TaxID=5698 RepID=A0A422N6D7_TRYRA|nr:uncharacterized protein TraAM80_07263 [Trypanosoma rangeli]RNF01020.1 hypothetical protein TraAM80_07263 [Trypanosoma rangeli]|eukprot:RNF01020.1 hypothetical protein TraAM80_07263 [Trypanosoma rangeli]